MRHLLSALALCATCAIGAADAAEITYTVTGSFDVSLNGTEYDGLGVTLTGKGNPDHVFFPTGPQTPVVYLPALTASVTGYGEVTLSDTFLYFSNNTTGINGFTTSILVRTSLGLPDSHPTTRFRPPARSRCFLTMAAT